MMCVWSKETSSRSPSSCSSSSRSLVAGESSTTWPLSNGSRASRDPTSDKGAERKQSQHWDTMHNLTFDVYFKIDILSYL